MESTTAHLEALLQLEARHDELLQQLDELDQRVQRVLKECLHERGCPDQQTGENQNGEGGSGVAPDGDARATINPKPASPDAPDQDAPTC
jgi:hypothetical protein